MWRSIQNLNPLRSRFSEGTAMIRIEYNRDAAFSKLLIDKFLELLRLLGHGENPLETVQKKSTMQQMREDLFG